MKKIYGTLAAVTVVIAMAGAAFAATTTGSVGATAVVTETCTIAGGSIDFGTVDRGAAGPIAATVVDPVINCTKNTNVAVTDNDGLYELAVDQPRMKNSASADYIPYTLTYATPLTGAGMASDIGGLLALSASIADGALDAAPAGNYSDTIVFTLTY